MLETARQIFRHRALLATLTARELKARYRGSVLGFLWSLANPLLLLGVYSVVFGLILAQRAEVSPYALFLVTGLFPWIWFATSLNEATVSLLANAGLIRRAVFPIELLPAVAVGANLVQLVLALPILAGGLVVGRAMGYPVSGWSALLFPLVVALELPLVAGLGLGLASLHVHFKDVRDLLQSALTLMFFMTPILYPLTAMKFSRFWWVLRLNPVTPFTLAYQELLFRGTVPGFSLWGQMIVVSALGWALGAALFARLRETLVEAV